jgi:hypothetical protein
MLTQTRVSSISWYYLWSCPNVTVIIIPKAQIIIVLQTSAKDRETGEISLDTVTAMGTEMQIEMTRPKFRRRRKVLSCIWFQY